MVTSLGIQIRAQGPLPAVHLFHDVGCLSCPAHEQFTILRLPEFQYL